MTRTLSFPYAVYTDSDPYQKVTPAVSHLFEELCALFRHNFDRPKSSAMIAGNRTLNEPSRQVSFMIYEKDQYKINSI
jgi:hypothetical protein